MSFPLDQEDVWCEVLRRPPRGAPALFLDRDGVVVEDTGYLCRIEDIALLRGAAVAIAAANAAGVPVILVTNQGGIGTRLYGWQEFSMVQRAILAQLAEAGAFVNAVYAAPHHPDGHGIWRHADHPARKPNPGMLTRAAAELGLDLKRSWMVGDKRSDVMAARRADLAGALHVLSGHGAAERAGMQATASDGFDLRFGESIAEAVRLPILGARTA